MTDSLKVNIPVLDNLINLMKANVNLSDLQSIATSMVTFRPVTSQGRYAQEAIALTSDIESLAKQIDAFHANSVAGIETLRNIFAEADRA